MTLRKTISCVAVTSALLLLAGCGSSSKESDATSGTTTTKVATEKFTSTTKAVTSTSTASTMVVSSDPPSVSVEQIAIINAPTSATVRPGTKDLYVTGQNGLVYRLVDSTGDAQTVLDVRGQTNKSGEQGLLGLAFSLDGNLLYLNFTDKDGNTNISEFKMTGNSADLGTQRIILEIAQPYDNHNGGCIRTLPDGTMLIGTGDGGSAGDPEDRAQNISILLGKMLRIDPRGSKDGKNYTIPLDNPYASGGDGAPEIFAIGMRNPWKFELDAPTNKIFVADVGQDAIEEVDRTSLDEMRGANFGWSFREGTQEFKGEKPAKNVDPVWEYPHDDGACSISGGAVSRSSRLPKLYGWYVYADYCNGMVQAFRADDASPTAVTIMSTMKKIVAIDSGADGEIYVLSQASNAIYRFVD